MFNPVKELSRYYCDSDSGYADVVMDVCSKLMYATAECLQMYDYPDDDKSITDLVVELSEIIVRLKKEYDEANSSGTDTTPIAKSCPFCGQTPSIWDYVQLDDGFTLSHHCPCRGTHLTICTNVYGETIKDVVDIWNHRCDNEN